jgi:dolichol-phosphate mannosyltransferase
MNNITKPAWILFKRQLGKIMKIMAMIPTYNEVGNIRKLIDEILKLNNNIEIVVVDDNSPDGTWKIVKEMQENNSRIHLIHRIKEKGRGSAGIAGFIYAVQHDADFVIEMDADFSHHPKYIPSLLAKADQDTVVIGSRLVGGGNEAGRSPIRKIITNLASRYIRLILNVPVKDCTSGYRVFSRKILQRINLEQMKSNGPAIVQEILIACKREGFSFIEIPIMFEERYAGESTFNFKIMLAGLISVIKFRINDILKLR